MKFILIKRIAAAVTGAAIITTALMMPINTPFFATNYGSTYTASAISLNDAPSEYQYALDWIWNTRIQGEKSVEAWDTIYDQIVAGNGILHYIVKWHTYKSISLQQRQDLQKVLEKAINDWTDWLVGYDNWPYDHINVEIVGWAVLDEGLLLDRQSYEKVYTDTVPYDNSYDIANGMGNSTIPTVVPIGPHELYRYDHWADKNYVYPGGYENRFDMYLQATQGMIDMGGYGYYWGQQLSDNVVLGLADGTTSIHILEHEIGHGFGLTDFYGEEGEADGFPPGGFPGGSSIMMAGSSAVITDFDGWMFRYVWSKIKEEKDRFDLSSPVVPTEPPTEPSSESTEAIRSISFTDTISDVGDTYIIFTEHGTFTFGDSYFNNDPQKDLSNYDAGDKISISFQYTEINNTIILIDSLTLIENVRDIPNGDVNTDGIFSLADVIMMQKWILAAGDITNWKAGDMDKNEILNIFDLVLMKQALLNQ